MCWYPESFLPRLDVGNLQIATNCPDKPIFWKTFIPCPGNRRFDDISLVTANTPDVIECFKRSDGKFERGKKNKKRKKKNEMQTKLAEFVCKEYLKKKKKKKKKKPTISDTRIFYIRPIEISKKPELFFHSSHSKNFLFFERCIFLWINCQLVIIT